MSDYGGASASSAGNGHGFGEEAQVPRSQMLAQRFQQGVDYVRSLEPEEIRDEIESEIRARPLLSIGLAALAGFLVGRLVRR